MEKKLSLRIRWKSVQAFKHPFKKTITSKYLQIKFRYGVNVAIISSSCRVDVMDAAPDHRAIAHADLARFGNTKYTDTQIYEWWEISQIQCFSHFPLFRNTIYLQGKYTI